MRFLIGAAVLWPLARRRPRTPGVGRAALLCASALGAGYIFQTVGLQYTSASTSAFITYLFVAIVPVLAALLLRRTPRRWTVAGVLVCTAGLVLLTGGASGFGLGEALTVGCAVSFAFHVVFLAEQSPRHDPWRLTALQLAIVGGACIVPGAVLDGFAFTTKALVAAAFTAIAASAIALGLQTWGQRHVGPSRTSVLLMLEPVAAAILGYLLGERLGLVGWAGAALILGGIVLAELPGLRSAD